MNIRGKRVIIRAIENKDLEYLKNSINDAELEKFESGFSFPISAVAQERWYESNSAISLNGCKMIIEYNEEAVGYTNILNIDWKNRTAWNGIKLFDSKYRGRGLGTDAVMAIMRYCFDELNLNRLESKILTYNKASYALYVEKCGWKVEGTKRKSVFKNGKYYDEYYVSILKDEYYELIKTNSYWVKDETKFSGGGK